MRKGEKMSEIQKIKIRQSRKGKLIGNTYGFKKGIKPWNKGTKGLQIGWNKGITPSKESLAKMVATRKAKGNYIAWNKGKKNPDMIGNKNAVGHTPWNKGIPVKEEDRKKMGIKNIGKIPWNKGVKSPTPPEKHYNWKGGVTPVNHKIRQSLEMKYWRKANMEMNDFTCQKCMQIGGQLIVHHINNFADFPELRTSISNGITFCKKCHCLFHNKYGKKNNTKEQLLEFLTTDSIVNN